MNQLIQIVLSSPCGHLNQHLKEKPKKKREAKESKGKVWMRFKLMEFSKEKGYKLTEEFYFHDTRGWRFDFCIKEIKIGFEYEGIKSKKSRHTTSTGYTGDIEKYNAAQELGYRVYRYTALNYLDLTIDLGNIEV